MGTPNSVAADRTRGARILETAARLGVEELVARHLAEGTTPLEFEGIAMEHRRSREFIGFRLGRFIEAVGANRQAPKHETFERTMAEIWAERRGESFFEPRTLFLPWSELARRDLNTADNSAGGYLASTSVMSAAEALRPWSVAVRSGLQVVEGVREGQTLPVPATNTTIEWLPTEATAATASTPTLAAVAGAPKVAVGLLNYGRNVRAQTNIEAYLRRELLRVAGRAIDAAVLGGTGASGQPLGVRNHPNVNTQSGTTLAHTGAVAMKTAAATAGAPDESLAFVATPAVRGLLEGRERATGLGFIWDNGRIAGVPGYATPDLPAATMICGAWDSAMLLLYGTGITIDFNPFNATLFPAGGVQARALVEMDLLVPIPTAFTVAATVT